MKIAVLSGKGGTGKTMVSASMAMSIGECQYADCDVEEPNGYLFLNPDLKETVPVNVDVPKINSDLCDLCRECSRICQFNALAVLRGGVMVFEELCHHCGACAIACPKNAISKAKRPVGVIEMDEDCTFIQGRLNIGEPVSIPVLKEIKRYFRKDLDTIVDCSPGAACGIVETLEGIDYCLLVSEPNPFGLYDLDIAVRLVEKLSKKYGIIINKAQEDVNIINEYCLNRNIDILMEIPFSEDIAVQYSHGILPVSSDDDLKNRFIELYERIAKEVQNEADRVC